MTFARTMSLPLLVLLSMAVLAGCAKGPAASELQSVVQSNLDGSFPKGLFTINSFHRRGHYPYEPDGDKREHVLVYYDAELALSRKHTLTNWDALNVGSLITVLGATPLGVKGVKPEGNGAGDILTVHGAMPFAREGDAWKLSTFTEAEEKPGEPAPNDQREVPYRQKLERIAELGKKLHAKSKGEDLAHLTAELEGVRSNTERRMLQRDGLLTLATGSDVGEYYRHGQRFAGLLSEKGTEAHALTSSGSIENCRLVESDEVQFAYSQNDIVHMAYNGTGLFKRQLPMRHLRSLASLYPEAVHVVTLRDRGIESIADLRGKRVDVGVDGSGSRINAVEILEAAGLDLRDLDKAQGKHAKLAFADLERGNVDAVITTSAFPNPLVRELAEKQPIVLLSIDDETMARLRERSPFIIGIQLPDKTYPGMGAACATAGVTATLIAHENTRDELVKKVLDTMFSSVERLSEGSPQAYLISAKRARSGLSVPLHPAAERWLLANVPE